MIHRIFDFWPFDIKSGPECLGLYFMFCFTGLIAAKRAAPADDGVIDFTGYRTELEPAPAEESLIAARRALGEYASAEKRRSSPLVAIAGVLFTAAVAAGILWVFVAQ